MLKKSFGEDWERSSMKGMLDEAFKIAAEGTHQRSEADRRAEREERAEARRTEAGPSPATARPSGAALMATARSILTSDGPIGGAVGVVDSLKNGDAKGALKGAIAFVPPGPIKVGLNLLASLF
jgi:hypothetical protein